MKHAEAFTGDVTDVRQKKTDVFWKSSPGNFCHETNPTTCSTVTNVLECRGSTERYTTRLGQTSLSLSLISSLFLLLRAGAAAAGRGAGSR